MPEKTCYTCKYWQPRYQGVGRCTKEGSFGAKFWTEEQKTLYMLSSFSCQSHEQQDPVAKDTI